MKSFVAGAHTIANFNPAQDILSFAPSTFASVAAVVAAASDTGGGVAINLGGGSSLLLPGITTSQFSQQNFHIG